MIARSLMPSLSLVTLRAAHPVYLVDVSQCSLPAEGRAKVIGFGASHGQRHPC